VAPLPPPTDPAALAAAEGPADTAESDVLRGRWDWLDEAWLNFRYLVIKGVARLRELRPRTLNISWITNSLAIGGAYHPRDVKRLRAQGVDAIVDLREEACDDRELLARHGIELLHLPTPDMRAPSQAALDEGVAWISAKQARGNRVFIHCMHGAGRAPTLGAAVLVANGYRAIDAMRLIRARRWQTVPNAGQLDGLREYEQRHRQR
jgi:protein tyrosine phosphatase (PTP) superfamily phosphohydrolase (DUF442 family)